MPSADRWVREDSACLHDESRDTRAEPVRWGMGCRVMMTFLVPV